MTALFTWRWMARVGGLLWAIVFTSGCVSNTDDSTSRILAFGGEGVRPLVRTGVQPNGAVVQPQMGPDGQKQVPALGFTPEEDIHFTDPDNPESSLPELSAILAKNSGRRDSWEQSITIAKRLSVREGKSILIWFTDSARSPMCKALSRELFSKQAFEKWADENLIRLQIDSSLDLSEMDLSLGQQETMRTEMRTYVSRLKKKYRILGTPSLVLLSPSGAVMGRYRGFKKGQSDFTWGLIKQGVVASNLAHQSWRKGLEKRGYREWEDQRGRKLFAKLGRYQDGVLTFIEPDGTRSSTKESKLSAADREWIQEQKRSRGIE